MSNSFRAETRNPVRRCEQNIPLLRPVHEIPLVLPAGVQARQAVLHAVGTDATLKEIGANPEQVS
jgi:hypothetical protein